MIGYKIKYGVYGHDCWGAREFCGWNEYDSTVYTDINKINKIVEELNNKHSDKEFKVYEVEIL